MSYEKICHTKFVKNKNTSTHVINNRVSVSCLDMGENIGLSLNNISFPKGEYLFNIDIITNNQLILYFEESNNEMHTILLKNGSNSYPFKCDNTKMNIRILFKAPNKQDTFELIKFTCEKMSYDAIKMVEHSNLFNFIGHIYEIQTHPITINILNNYTFIPCTTICDVQIESNNIPHNKLTNEEFTELRCYKKIIEDAITKMIDSVMITNDNVVFHNDFDKITKDIEIDKTIQIVEINGIYVFNRIIYREFLSLIEKYDRPVCNCLEDLVHNHATVHINDRKLLIKYSELFDGLYDSFQCDLSVVILFQNNDGLNDMDSILKCYKSIDIDSSIKYEVVIVCYDANDNIIYDMMREYITIQKKIENIKVICVNNKDINLFSTGLKYIRGRHVTLVRSDCYYKTNALYKMYNMMDDDSGYIVVVSGYEMSDEGDDKNSRYFSDIKRNNKMKDTERKIRDLMRTITIENIDNYASRIQCCMFSNKILQNTSVNNNYECVKYLLQFNPCGYVLLDESLMVCKNFDDVIIHPTNIPNTLVTKRSIINKMLLCDCEKRMKNNAKDILVYVTTIDTFETFNRLFDPIWKMLKSMTKYYNCIIIHKNKNDIAYDSSNIDVIDNIYIMRDMMYYKMANVCKRINIIYDDVTLTHDIVNKISNDVNIFYFHGMMFENASNVEKEKMINSINKSTFVIYTEKRDGIILCELNKTIQMESLFLDSLFVDDQILADISDLCVEPIKYDNKIIVGCLILPDMVIDYELIKILTKIDDTKNITFNIYSTYVVEDINCKVITEYNQFIDFLCHTNIFVMPTTEVTPQIGKLFNYFVMMNKPIIGRINNNSYAKYIKLEKMDHMVIYRILMNLKSSTNVYQNNKNCNNPRKLYNRLLHFKRTYQKHNKKCLYVSKAFFDGEHEEVYQNKKYTLNICNIMRSNGITVEIYQLGKVEGHTIFDGISIHTISDIGLEVRGDYYVGYSNMISNIINNSTYDVVVYGSPYVQCSDIPIKIRSICINRNVVECYPNQKHSLIISNDMNYISHMSHIISTISNMEYVNDLDDKFKLFDVNDKFCRNIVRIFYANTRYSRQQNEIFNYILTRLRGVAEIIVYDSSKMIQQYQRHDSDDSSIINNSRFKTFGDIIKTDKYVDFESFLDSTHIVVIPSIEHENSNTLCMKSLMHNCVVITTTLNSSHSLIINNFNGFIVTPTAQNILNTLEYVCNHDNVRHEIMTNNHLIMKSYDNYNWVDKITDIFMRHGLFYTSDVNNVIEKCNILADNKKRIVETKICFIVEMEKMQSINDLITCELKHIQMDVIIIIHNNHCTVRNYIDNDMNCKYVLDTELYENIIKYDIILFNDLSDDIGIILNGVRNFKIHVFGDNFEIKNDTCNCDESVSFSLESYTKYMDIGKKCNLICYPIDTDIFHQIDIVDKSDGYISIICFGICSEMLQKTLNVLSRTLCLHAHTTIKNKIIIVSDEKNIGNKRLELLKSDNIEIVNCSFTDFDNFVGMTKYAIFLCDVNNNHIKQSILFKLIACNVPSIVPCLSHVKDIYSHLTRNGCHNICQLYDKDDSNELIHLIIEMTNIPIECSNGFKYIQKYNSIQKHCEQLLCVMDKHINL